MNGAVLRVFGALLVGVALSAGADEAALRVVFFEDFESHGASSARQPTRWVQPAWDMPRSSAGAWAIATNYYGSTRNPVVARQNLVGNLGAAPGRWAETSDLRIAPDPVTGPFRLEFAVLRYPYLRGLLAIRLVDSAGNGYGCRVAMTGEPSAARGWRNAISRWDAGAEHVLEESVTLPRIPTVPGGGVAAIALLRDTDGDLVLTVDGRPIARGRGRKHDGLSKIGLRVEPDSRVAVDDIKLSSQVEK